MNDISENEILNDEQPQEIQVIPAPADRAPELAQLCLTVCQEKKAEDIILFDVQGKTVLADFFLVCCGNSKPHIRALADHIRNAMAEQGFRPRGLDGTPGTDQWIVLDYGSLIIHILDREAREFYRLEELWDDRKIIFRSNNSQAAEK